MGMFGNYGAALGAAPAEGYETDAVNKARATQGAQYNTDQGYYQPYYNAGTSALGQLSNNLNSGAYNTSVTPQNLSGDPGYQFQLQQGQQALQRSAAAHGGLMSGAFMKGLDSYSQGLASTQYQNAWNRQFQQNQFNYNSLANMAGMGERSAGSMAGMGERYGNTMAGYDTAEGNIHAAAIMGLLQNSGAGADGMVSDSISALGAVNGKPGGGGGGSGGGGISAGNPDSMAPLGGGYGAIPQQSYGYGGGGGGGQSLGSIGYAQPIPAQGEGPGYGYSPNSGIPWSGGGY